eukprot:CFRG5282T1
MGDEMDVDQSRETDDLKNELESVSQAVEDKERRMRDLELEIERLKEEVSARSDNTDNTKDAEQNIEMMNTFTTIANSPHARNLIPPWLMGTLELYEPFASQKEKLST